MLVCNFWSCLQSLTRQYHGSFICCFRPVLCVCVHCKGTRGVPTAYLGGQVMVLHGHPHVCPVCGASCPLSLAHSLIERKERCVKCGLCASLSHSKYSDNGWWCCSSWHYTVLPRCLGVLPVWEAVGKCVWVCPWAHKSVNSSNDNQGWSVFFSIQNTISSVKLN